MTTLIKNGTIVRAVDKYVGDILHLRFPVPALERVRIGYKQSLEPMPVPATPTRPYFR
jgi:hypothetical protein